VKYKYMMVVMMDSPYGLATQCAPEDSLESLACALELDRVEFVDMIEVAPVPYTLYLREILDRLSYGDG